MMPTDIIEPKDIDRIKNRFWVLLDLMKSTTSNMDWQLYEAELFDYHKFLHYRCESAVMKMYQLAFKF